MSEIIPEDVALQSCNETELLYRAWKQGLGHLRMGLPREELIGVVSGAIPLRKEHVSQTMETRRILQDFIQKNFSKLRSQLPGCDGMCVTFSCTEGKHALCLYPNKHLLG